MKNIALLLKTDTEKGIKCGREAIEILLENGCTLFAEEKHRDVIGEYSGITYTQENGLYEKAECVVVFGGDGTIMRAAHSTDLPILAINLGRIGYLAELETDELHLLKDLVDDRFTIDYRMRLRCVAYREKEQTVIYESSKILNEIVLSKGSHSAMPEIEVYCNDEEVGKYFSDGLICATPTGSTAYSLSAGGPLLDPSCGSFCISHICPQSFYAKSMVFGQRNVLTFRKGQRGHGDLFLTADGQLITEIKDGDEVLISRSKKDTKLIKIKKNKFYSVMRSKLSEK